MKEYCFEPDPYENLYKNLNVRGQFSMATAQAAFMAGKEMGIPVSILAEEGESIALENGINTNVSKNCVYLEVANNGRDLSKFWERVNKIKTKQT